jgi:hypothetical protein
MNKTVSVVIAYANNMMFISCLMIILTIFGHSSLAAEIGLVCSVVSSIILLFSYNVKNIILLDNNKKFALKILSFRIVLSFLIIIIFFFILNTIQLNFFFKNIIIATVIIIIQQSLIEIPLFLNELKKNYRIFKYYDLFYIFNFLIILLNIFFFNNKYLLIILYLIIIINTFLLFFFINWKEILNPNFFEILNPALRLFELSSSVSIILSIFFWRIFIFMNYEKEISGILFSAFALGSFSGTLFSFIIGPSIINKKKIINLFSKIYFFMILFFSIAFLFMLHKKLFFKNLNYYQTFFFETALYSILGSAFMLFAVINRLYYFKYRKMDRKYLYRLDIFNSILISVVPLFLITVDRNFIKYSFLLSAFITFSMSYYFYRLKLCH